MFTFEKPILHCEVFSPYSQSLRLGRLQQWVAFARFSGVLFPLVAEDRYLIQPLHISTHDALSLSTAQLPAIGVILLLTFSNTLGLR